MCMCKIPHAFINRAKARSFICWEGPNVKGKHNTSEEI